MTRPHHLKYLLLALLILFAVLNRDLPARSGEIEFEHFSAEDGLSNKHVHCIMEDRYGFLWIGTNDGLNRYDGTRFVIYNHDPTDTTSPSAPNIKVLKEDEDGNIWVATSHLNLYRRQSDSFIRYAHDPNKKYSISENHVLTIIINRNDPRYVWMGTNGGGLNLFDSELQRFYTIKNDPENSNSISGDVITSLLQDSFGDFWIGTYNSGLNRVNLDSIPCKANGEYDVEHLNSIEFEHYLNSKENPESSNSLNVINIYEDSAKMIWVLLGNGNVLNFNREENRLSPCAYSIENKAHLHEMLEDRTGTLWFGGHGEVYNLDRNTNKVNDYRLNSGKIRSIANQGLCEDHSGNIWAATWDGIFRIHRSNSLFEHYYHNANESSSLIDNHVYSLLVDHTGKVWIGTEQGISVMTTDTNDSARLLDYSKLHEIEEGTVYSIITDAIGSIWAVIDRRLIRIDPETNSIIQYKNKPENHNALSFQEKRNWFGSVHLLADKAGNLWISAYGGGISMANLEELYSKNDLKDVEFTNYFNDPDSQSSSIADIIQDKFAFIWLAADEGGLIMLDPATGKFKNFKHTFKSAKSSFTQNVKVVQQDRNGNIWVGTYGGGLVKYDRERDSFTHIGIKDGLPNGIISGILEDDNDNLWISTNHGISKFNPEAHEFRNFDVADGLQGNEFNKCFFHDTLTGKMYFGGDNGFNVFHPDSIKKSYYVSPIVITKFTKFSEEEKGKVIIDRSVSAKELIKLKYKENIISFEFAALNLKKNNKNEYAYKLEGFTDDWINLGTKRDVTFTNLDPGRYTLKVKDSNEDGVWNAHPASIQIYISPPWWQTWWSYALYVVAFIGVLGGIRRVELKRRQEKENRKILELENERKTKELEEARKLQLSMLPDEVPQLPNLDLAVYMITATEVGGDFYDFHVSKDGTLTAIIADATGHGMQAGMMVSITKGLFQNLAGLPDLELIFHQFNQALCSMELQPLLMSLLLFRINGKALEIINGGMPGLLIYRKNNNCIEEIKSSGPPLGAYLDYPYEKYSSEISTDDVILTMSDGFAERFNEQEEMFGYNKWKDVLNEAAAETSRQMIDHFNNKSSDWAGSREPDDDMTFVILKCR